MTRRLHAPALLLACLTLLPTSGLAQTDAVAPPGGSDTAVVEEDVTPPAPTPPPQPAKKAPAAPTFQTRSATRAGGPANELNTGDDRARTTLPGGSAVDAVAGKDLFHGNYCGKGDRGPGLPPVDELDAACKRHDECFDQAGHPSCRCNAALRSEAYKVSEMKGLSRELRTRAASVMEAAQLMECRDP